MKNEKTLDVKKDKLREAEQHLKKIEALIKKFEKPKKEVKKYRQERWLIEIDSRK